MARGGGAVEGDWKEYGIENVAGDGVASEVGMDAGTVAGGGDNEPCRALSMHSFTCVSSLASRASSPPSQTAPYTARSAYRRWQTGQNLVSFCGGSG